LRQSVTLYVLYIAWLVIITHRCDCLRHYQIISALKIVATQCIVCVLPNYCVLIQMCVYDFWTVHRDILT